MPQQIPPLQYVARVLIGDRGFADTYVEVQNVGNDTVYNIRCKASLSFVYGPDDTTVEHAINQLPPGGSASFPCGSPDDVAHLLIEVCYCYKTQYSEGHLSELNDSHRKTIEFVTEVLGEGHPIVQRTISDLGAYYSAVLKGEPLVDFLYFDMSDSHRVYAGEALAPERHVVPSMYKRFISARWFDFITAESLTPLVGFLRNKNVLVLGKDTGAGLDRLRDIGKLLVSCGYTPVLLKTLEDLPSQSNEDKMLAVALLSRFTVVDDTEASGHIAELSILSRSRVLTVILRRCGAGGTYMQVDYDVDFSAFMKAWEYEESTLGPRLEEAIAWANSVIQSRASEYSRRYPWRSSLNPGASGVSE